MRSPRPFYAHARPALLLALLGAASTACIEKPQNGDVLSGNTLGKALSFTGKHSVPNMEIRIQVLNAPDNLAQNDPSVDANWVTIATAHSDDSPLFWNDNANPYFGWTKSATPAPNAGLAGRWPQGGILRFRAVDSDGMVLKTFDQDRLACYAEHSDQSWVSIGDLCKSEFSVAAAVSPSPTPADLATPPGYLAFAAGVGSTAETDAYYVAINAPDTLAAFKQRYGFGTPFSDEVSAVYFNAGDLGTGREMHCKTVLQLNAPPQRACYVSNYGASANQADNFGGDPPAALARAITGAESGAHLGAFATVAMVYNPPITDDNSVRFMVYDANDDLVNEAPLDSTGYNASIPQNCITCHGGANYSAAGHRVLGAGGGENGARFLPFDLDAFEFSTEAGYTRAAQEEKFRKLNRIVSLAEPAAATLELIDGWYAAGSVSTPGTKANTKFVPPSFAAQPSDAKIYLDVVAPYCRGCHVSQSGAFTFTDSEDFKSIGFLTDLRTCVVGPDPEANHLMPNAEVTLKRFWASPARAYLAGYLNSRGSCKP